MEKKHSFTQEPYSFINQAELQRIQQTFLQSWQELHTQAQQGMLGPLENRRFKAQEWSESQLTLLHAHLWQLYADTMQELAGAATQSPQLQQRLKFAAMQWSEALNPANYLLTNPSAIKKAIQTQGTSLLQGIKNLFEDLQKGRMLQTDESQFQVGVNLAATKGAVVYENELLQLIQYQPLQEKVYATPLFIVPPNINKYYILDLQKENSFVRYALENGMQVFLVSWRNPLPVDSDLVLDATWGDYLEHGVLEAARVVLSISKAKKLNALGFCVGGTMLASALSLAKARDEHLASSLTLLTAMLDFHDVGIINVFVDESLALLREWQLSSTRLMNASDLANTFAFLRPAELVWNYVTSNYLKGETPAPFDILYWNADSTNLPGPFFAWYFRNTYLENNLRVPGKIKIDGTPIDFGVLDMPTYVYASKEDHIVPWRTAYQSVLLIPGAERFVLGASGHVAGVINPPSQNKRHYWTSTKTSFDSVADDWSKQSAKQPGSWWVDWMQWLEKQAGAMKSAPAKLGSTIYPILEEAPGRYVKVKAVA